ncbi:MAG TPA: LLM class flavin-dependent oxidoreductase [Actinomycetota bacterium]|nr:LLM class flavin-dependent oxidoreductase [Actinomycetota bacterium]
MADFGIGLDFGIAPGADRAEHYRRVLEMLPPEFSTAWISDHLQFGDRPQLEGWTALTFLAAEFPRYRFGHLVLSQSFRNPALLAKMSATLQHLSGGRFILGIGAGWHEEEYHAYGYDYPSGGIRVAQLAETIEVIRALWMQSPATYHGTYHHIENAYCEPRPDPPIPIMVGTSGTKALQVAARLADWWNWDAPWEGVYREPYTKLRAHCDSIGRSFDDIVLTAGLPVNLPADPSTFEPAFEHSFYPGQTFYDLGPTAVEVIAEVERLVDLGVSHFQVAVQDLETLERFIAEVIPRVRLERQT